MDILYPTCSMQVLLRYLLVGYCTPAVSESAAVFPPIFIFLSSPRDIPFKTLLIWMDMCYAEGNTIPITLPVKT